MATHRPEPIPERVKLTLTERQRRALAKMVRAEPARGRLAPPSLAECLRLLIDAGLDAQEAES